MLVNFNKFCVLSVCFFNSFCFSMTFAEFEVSLERESPKLLKMSAVFKDCGFLSEDKPKKIALNAISFFRGIYEALFLVKKQDFSKLWQLLKLKENLLGLKASLSYNIIYIIIEDCEKASFFSETVLPKLLSFFPEGNVRENIRNIIDGIKQINRVDFALDRIGYLPVRTVADSVAKLDDESFCKFLEMCFFGEFFKEFNIKFGEISLNHLFAAEAYFVFECLTGKREPLEMCGRPLSEGAASGSDGMSSQQSTPSRLPDTGVAELSEGSSAGVVGSLGSVRSSETQTDPVLNSVT